MPPPIPPFATQGETPLATYGKAALICVPGIIFLMFEFVFIFPRAEAFWMEAGLTSSSAQWFFRMTANLFFSARLLGFVLGLGLLLLEFFWRPWPRWRVWTVATFAALFNLFVLTSLTTTSIVTALAVPMLIKKAKHPAPTEETR